LTVPPDFLLGIIAHLIFKGLSVLFLTLNGRDSSRDTANCPTHDTCLNDTVCKAPLHFISQLHQRGVKSLKLFTITDCVNIFLRNYQALGDDHVIFFAKLPHSLEILFLIAIFDHHFKEVFEFLLQNLSVAKAI
jgi:hypothetical protein